MTATVAGAAGRTGGDPGPAGGAGGPATSAPPAERRRRRRLLGENPLGGLLAGPYIIFIAVVFAYPIVFSVWMSFHDYFSANPAYEQFGDQASRTVDVPNVPNSIEIWQTFRDGYSKAVIFGENDIDSFLSDTASKIDELATGK